MKIHLAVHWMNRTYLHYLIIATGILINYSCSIKSSYSTIEGEALGTYYRFTYDSNISYQKQIDSIFYHYNKAANTYIETSELSEFNSTGKVIFRSPYLPEMLELYAEFYKQTNHSLNPSLMPLIKAWGFGSTERVDLTDQEVDSLLNLTSMDNIVWDKNKLFTDKNGVMLDFSSIGEGYAIDMISTFFDTQGIENYMVEIGGEMRCKGVNPQKKVWRIGIESPVVASEESTMTSVVELDNMALSTSGSYRKFFIDESGKKRSHIISPITGYPVQHSLLSTSIIANKSVVADALATSCMVMGPDSAKKFIEENKEIEGQLIYEENKELVVWQSSGFKKYVL